MNRFTDSNYPVMRYTCPQCTMVLFRNDLKFREFLMDIFNHAYDCAQLAQEAGVPVERERGN